jgi:ATP-binding cassette subfamily F protein 3
MINISNLSLYFGDRILFDNIGFTIKDNDKIGIVGRNGAGKTTLFKIILKELTPDTGQVLIPNNKTTGYLKQELNLNPENSVITETLSAFDEINKMEEDLKKIEKELETREDFHSKSYLQLVEKMVALNDIIKHHDVGSLKGNIEKVLKGLGFENNDFNRKIKEFSGGWQIRIELAKLLLRQPDYILLDEPTNHLDIEAIIWLEDYLSSYPGSVLLISHDQRFLDNVTKRTIEIENAKVYDYPVPYTKFVELRKDRREKLIAAYTNQQAVIKQKERTIERFMAKATKTKLAQSMQKQLDKMDKIEIEEFDTKAMKLIFPPADRSGRIVVKANKLTKSYGDNTVLKDIDLTLERGEKVSFVGQNGQGKTTLAKIIVNKLNFESGSLELGHNVKIGYYAQNQSDLLDTKLTVLETMENNATEETRTNIRKLLGAFLFSGEDVEKKVVVLSGGEKARLAIAVMLLRPFNFLVLDEPTNHLDILSKNVLKQALKDYNGSMILVSHDREFLSDLTDKTIEFRDHKLKTYLGDINYFLEKRQIDDIRNIELSDSSKKIKIKEKEKASSKLSYEERKSIKRELQKIEREIEKLEKEIQELEKLMLDPEFHSSPDAAEKFKEHANKKLELENAMEEWEVIQEKAENL